jgi:hypothetical protein
MKSATLMVTPVLLSAERVPLLMPENMLHDNANAYDGGTDYSYAASLHSIKSA